MIERTLPARSLLAVLMLTGVVTACSAIDTIDPPDLRLDAASYSNLPRGDYVVTNGKGEVLMEAPKLRPGDERTARFDLDKLDGVINIEVRNVDRVTYSQTLRHAPGKPIKVEWNETRETFLLTEIPPPEPPRGSSTRDGGGGGKD
ncbi:hypothetical protein AAFN88_14775 [Pelagibius sp. CAU 1746]|uniref:hypothetical protein n=1 Tax=Pelagibius sp. CAU 1746 TaxID=3140370 RepID=UPI00325BDC65